MSAWEFHVGQRVVCVDADPDNLGPTLVEGEIYTVRAIYAFDDFPWVFLALRGVGEDTRIFFRGDYYPCGFWSERFRSLPKKRTDISALRDLLSKPVQKMES